MAALDPNALLTKNAFLGNDGLLHKLQSSEEFISLRGQEDSPRMKMPALFRTEGRKKPTAADKEAVLVFSARLEELRKRFGWEHGERAPESSRAIEVPAPFAGGDIDPRRRLKVAERMLAVSFAKTTARNGKAWLKGFSIQFAGDDAGIDHGGLTKAWVQEVAHALWGSEAFFDTTSAGSFFKPDTTTDMLLHAFHVPSESLYRWLGRFLAYALYQQCVLDCALSPWALRWLMRVTETQAVLPALLKEVAGSWRRDGSDDSRIATISGAVLLSHMDTWMHLASCNVIIGHCLRSAVCWKLTQYRENQLPRVVMKQCETTYDHIICSRPKDEVGLPPEIPLRVSESGWLD